MKQTTDDTWRSGPAQTEKRAWYAIVLIALIAGLYFRFKGFSQWPLATDEYYIYRAIHFVLDSGLPEFPCGGYYARGLLYQYLVAPLLLVGLSPEASLRLVTILSNIAMLPAAYLLARHIGGFRVAAATLVILSLSTWEIEMARFGRMYAPFQAVFLWYLYHAYLLVEKQELRRWRWLLALSGLASFLWEGGIILAIGNLFLLFMGRHWWRPLHAVSSIALLGAVLAFLTINFRFLGSPPPAQTQAGQHEAAQRAFGFLDDLNILAFNTLQEPSFEALLVLLMVVTIWGVVRLLRSSRLNFFSLATVTASVAAVFLNQVLLALHVVVLAGLAGWFRLREAAHRDYRLVVAASCAVIALWFLLALIDDDTRGVIGALKTLFGFPELHYSLVYQWQKTNPLMLVFLALGAGLLLARTLLAPPWNRPGLRLLLAILVLSVMLIGSVPTLYNESRYSFHIYPLLIVLTIFSFSSLFESRQGVLRFAHRWAPLVAIIVFMASADFSPGHLFRIASYEANFRIGYTDARARHYFPRFDFRGPANYVNRLARPNDTIIITNVGVAQYLTEPAMVYLHEDDPRYRGQACPSGDTERWTAMPLLSQREQLDRVMDTRNRGGKVWVVADEQTMSRTLPRGYLTSDLKLERTFISRDQRFEVYVQRGE